METNNVGEEGLRHGLSNVRVRQGDEVAVLAEAVDNREDDRLPVHPWQWLHEVEADVRPNGRRDGKRQEQSRRMKVLRLVPLTSRACPHKVLHQTTHIGKVKVAVETMKRAVDALVPIIMDSRHDLLE